jgi:hypothetical protein
MSMPFMAQRKPPETTFAVILLNVRHRSRPPWALRILAAGKAPTPTTGNGFAQVSAPAEYRRLPRRRDLNRQGRHLPTPSQPITRSRNVVANAHGVFLSGLPHSVSIQTVFCNSLGTSCTGYTASRLRNRTSGFIEGRVCSYFNLLTLGIRFLCTLQVWRFVARAMPPVTPKRGQRCDSGWCCWV